MSNETIAAFLENYNKWRRGDESLPMPKPQDIGEAIDCAVAYLRHDDSIISTNGGELTRLKKRMAEAVAMLHDLIDGGEECRGYDSALSGVIRKLEGSI